jgi:putative membrane protein
LPVRQLRSVASEGNGFEEEERKMGFTDMMAGWGANGFSWAMYAGMMVFWVAAAVLVVWGINALVVSRGAQTAPWQAQEDAVDVLKRRYAAGEINSVEYEQKKRDLF